MTFKPHVSVIAFEKPVNRVSFAVIQFQDERVLQSSFFGLVVFAGRVLKVCKAWRQEAERSDIQLQTESREKELKVGQAFKPSKPDPQ